MSSGEEAGEPKRSAGHLSRLGLPGKREVWGRAPGPGGEFLSSGALAPCAPHRSAGQPERGELRGDPHGVVGRLAEP